MITPIKNQIAQIIELALNEDIGKGDLTSVLFIPKTHKARAVIVTKDKGILCGVGVCKFIFKQVDKRIEIRHSLKDGSFIKQGTIIMNIEGPCRGILTAERTILNFLGRLSGIATLTHQFVAQIKPYKAKILDTRKTTPGLRYLEKYAVKTGGGFNHRMGLYESVLIKTNHLLAYSVERIADRNVIREMIERARESSKGKFVEIEVQNFAEFHAALEAKPDVIMLDNWTLPDIRKAVLYAKRYPLSAKPLLEVSGGVTLSNVRDIAKTGVDRISIGALTHSARCLDMALEIV